MTPVHLWQEARRIRDRPTVSALRCSFLGANIDAVETAARFGSSADRSQNYHADSEGVELNLRVMSVAVASFREHAAMPKGWNEEIEKDYKKRGAGK